MALCGVMWRYEIGAFSRFLRFSENLRNLGKTVALCGVMWRYEIGALALCGVMWRYEIGAFSRFLRFSEICEIWENSGAMWRYVALRNWCFFAFLRFSENL